jgi:hypothetical protein
MQWVRRLDFRFIGFSRDLRNPREHSETPDTHNMSHKPVQTVGHYKLHKRSLTNFHCLLHKPVTAVYYLESRKGFEFLKLTGAPASRNFRLMCNQAASISCLELIIYWLQFLYCRTDGDWLRRLYCRTGGDWLQLLYCRTGGDWLQLLHCRTDGNDWLQLLYCRTDGDWLQLLYCRTDRDWLQLLYCRTDGDWLQDLHRVADKDEHFSCEADNYKSKSS